MKIENLPEAHKISVEVARLTERLSEIDHANSVSLIHLEGSISNTVYVVKIEYPVYMQSSKEIQLASEYKSNLVQALKDMIEDLLKKYNDLDKA